MNMNSYPKETAWGWYLISNICEWQYAPLLDFFLPLLKFESIMAMDPMAKCSFGTLELLKNILVWLFLNHNILCRGLHNNMKYTYIDRYTIWIYMIYIYIHIPFFKVTQSHLQGKGQPLGTLNLRNDGTKYDQTRQVSPWLFQICHILENVVYPPKRISKSYLNHESWLHMDWTWFKIGNIQCSQHKRQPHLPAQIIILTYNISQTQINIWLQHAETLKIKTFRE